MKTIIKKILLFLNGLAVIGMLLCYVAGAINPEKIPIFSFFSLLYPILLFVNIVFIFLWGIFLKKYILLSIIVILIRVDYIPLYIQKNKQKSENTTETLDVLCFNVDLFRYEKKNTSEEYIDSFMEMVSAYEPEVICFQEFLSDNTNKKEDVLRLLKNEHRLSYFYSLRKGKKLVRSNTIVSKYPIINQGSIFDESSKLPRQKFIFADLKVGKDTVRVYNVHFSSYHLDEQDKATYDNMVNQQEFDNKGGKILLKKLIKTMKKHGPEVTALLNHIEQCPYKKIICGDFNDTPASYAYQKLRKYTNDAFCAKGSGFGTTYSGPFPAFRIDYILYDDHFSVQKFNIINTPISDHYPLVASFQILTDSTVVH